MEQTAPKIKVTKSGRSRKPTVGFDERPLNCNRSWKPLWSQAEKKRLFSAMRTFSTGDVNVLHNYLQTKDTKQISSYLRYLKKLQTEKKDSSSDTINYKFAPIDHWLRTTENLLSTHNHDLSQVIEKVFHVIAHLECEKTPSSPSSLSKGKRKTKKQNLTSVVSKEKATNVEPSESTSTDSQLDGKLLSTEENSSGNTLAIPIPNYRAIYGYLGALLNKSPPPDLKGIDCKVVLELIKELLSVLQVSDLAYRRSIMVQKYNLLNKPFDINNIKACQADIVKAFEVGSTNIGCEDDCSSMAENCDKSQASTSSETIDHDDLVQDLLKFLDGVEVTAMGTHLRAETAAESSDFQYEDEQVTVDNGDAKMDNTETRCKTRESKRIRSNINKLRSVVAQKPLKPVRIKKYRNWMNAHRRKTASKFYTLNPFQIPVKLLKFPPKVKPRSSENSIYNLVELQK